MTITQNQKEAIISDAISKLEDGVGIGVEQGELHNELFNMDYFIIGTYQATEFLGSNAFDAIGTIQAYENEQFGEVTTDLSDPEKVVNMFAYIVGEEALNDCVAFTDLTCHELDSEDITAIISDLKELI